MRSIKTIALMCLVLILLTASALADSLTDAFDAQYALLFETDNATLNLEADFSLDGEVFKRITVSHIQEGMKAFRELITYTPRMNGTIRESGYTILNDGYCIYGIESGYPDMVNYYYAQEKQTILRKRIEGENLLALLRALLQGMDRQQTTANGDGTVTICLSVSSDDIPQAMQAAFSLSARYLAERYFDVYISGMKAGSGVCIHDYNTVSEGILYAMNTVNIRKTDCTAVLDDQGRLASFEGFAELILTEGSGETHTLTVNWSESAGEYGTSIVPYTSPWSFNRWYKIEGQDMDDNMTAQTSPDNTEVTWTMSSGETVVILMENKGLYNDYFSDPAETGLSLQDAWSIAMAALAEKYGVAEEKLAAMSAAYGYRDAADAYFTVPYWQFDLDNPEDPLDFYEIILSAQTG